MEGLVGLRKFILAVLLIVSFTVLMFFQKVSDPFELGLGLGLLISPIIAGNVSEYINFTRKSPPSGPKIGG